MGYLSSVLIPLWRGRGILANEREICEMKLPLDDCGLATGGRWDWDGRTPKVPLSYSKKENIPTDCKRVLLLEKLDDDDVEIGRGQAFRAIWASLLFHESLEERSVWAAPKNPLPGRPFILLLVRYTAYAAPAPDISPENRPDMRQ